MSQYPAASADGPDGTWTPSSLNRRIRDDLADLTGLSVRGEISNLRYQSSGHVYFELKDASSRVRATIWRSTAARMALRLRDGMAVICTGSVDVWVAGGTYSLIVNRIEESGLGAMWLALQQLKAELREEGLFDEARKRPLPFLPQTVGIVTSSSGAALRDMLRILQDRFPVRVVLAPAKVQGDGAAESIARAIEALDTSGLCDVVIVGRGGGSIEDLWAFNEVRVVRAVAACRTPIVSAVGHETDTLLSDYAADRRAPTPTAAAEMVVPERDKLHAGIKDALWRIRQVIGRQVGHERRHLLAARQRLGRGDTLLGHRAMGLDELERRLGHAARRGVERARRSLNTGREALQASHPMRRLARQRRALIEFSARLRGVRGRIAVDRRTETERLTGLLRAYDPRSALRRGYGIVRDADSGLALRSTREAHTGQRLDVLLAEGALDCTVEGLRPALSDGPDSLRADGS